MFAIGLPPVFSLRWNLPPALSCNPKQLDSVTRTTSEASKKQTGLSPSLIPCSKGLLPGAPQVTHATTPLKVWQHGLFPLQSPLLRESLLVSFPPLNYMLKFSGSSCLIGDPREMQPRTVSTFIVKVARNTSTLLSRVHRLLIKGWLVLMDHDPAFFFLRRSLSPLSQLFPSQSADDLVVLPHPHKRGFVASRLKRGPDTWRVYSSRDDSRF